jgi:hypothetical protein
MGWYQKRSALYHCIICLTLFHETRARNLILFSVAASIVIDIQKIRKSEWAGFKRDQPCIVASFASLYFMKPEQEI